MTMQAKESAAEKAHAATRTRQPPRSWPMAVIWRRVGRKLPAPGLYLDSTGLKTAARYSQPYRREPSNGVARRPHATLSPKNPNPPMCKENQENA